MSVFTLYANELRIERDALLVALIRAKGVAHARRVVARAQRKAEEINRPRLPNMSNTGGGK